MAASLEGNVESFRQQEKTAFVLGYTGETGKVLVEELAKDKLFKRVVLIGRREVQLPETCGPEFEQKVVDFENLDAHADTFKDLDVGFCCIGTTRAKAGEAGFVRVDHDYVLKSAEVAKAGGTKHFQLMSSTGADHKSSFLYPRTKGQVEEALKVIHFERLTILRPAVLMGNRSESRPMERVAKALLVPVAKLFPTAITIPFRVVARAMINSVVIPSGNTVDTLENKAIHILSKSSIDCPAKQTESPKNK